MAHPRIEALALAAYAALLRLATPLYLARLWWRGRREPGYRQHLAQRLGVYRGRAEPGALWLHAVSLGETRAASALIDALRAQRPGLRLLLTHGTATGREAGLALLREGDRQAWLPYDTPGAVRRFLRHFAPAAGVLMETELWPALMREAERVDLPVLLANARLSERSAGRGRRLAWLLHPAARRLSWALAQTEADAERLRAAGAPRVRVVGNLKFDVTPPADAIARGRAWRAGLSRPVVLAASTREGEEAMLLDAWAALSTTPPAPRPLLVIVPRHPQRFDEVGALVVARGLTLIRRSQWGESAPAVAARADVWLGDTMGELPLYYALADVALLGGSFAPLGGQNLIEAAACGCPMVMGPHTFNFADAAARALAAGAARRADSIDDGIAQALALLDDPARDVMARAALAFAAAHRGAAMRMARRIADMLAGRKSQATPPTS